MRNKITGMCQMLSVFVTFSEHRLTVTDVRLDTPRIRFDDDCATNVIENHVANCVIESIACA